MTDKVWWFRPDEQPKTPLASISPWGDYNLKDPYDRSVSHRRMRVHNNLDSGNKPFGEKDRPTAFFIKKSPRDGHLVPQDDFNIGYSGIYIITEAMHALLSKFDLGDTQMIELPLYDATRTLTASRLYDVQPDFNKPLPGRWFLLHVTARKNSFSYEASRGITSYNPSYPFSPNVPY